MVAVEKKRVLVVDDDPDLLQLVRILLARAGVDVLTALSVPDARQLLYDGTPPDLVVLDIMMPEISGVELLHEIRGLSEFDGLPVLMLSALIDPEQIRVALNAGADRYLTKPYVASSLVTVVQELLNAGRVAN